MRGDIGDNRSFEESAFAVEVSANGGLLLLQNQVNPGQWIKLRQESTGKTELCMVVRQEPAEGGYVKAGVEFWESHPKFWHIAFPPDDWRCRTELPKESIRTELTAEGRKYLQDEIGRVIADHWTVLKLLYENNEQLSFGRGKLSSVTLTYAGSDIGYAITLLGTPFEIFRFPLSEMSQFQELHPLIHGLRRFIEPSSGRIEGLFRRVTDPSRSQPSN